jgi:hypothetical protein
MKDIGEAKRVTFQLSPEWKITHDELYNIPPSEADGIQGFFPMGVSIWHTYFGQDLLQIRNDKAGLLLDVGWYPHADASGHFGLKLIKIHQDECLWESPIETFVTRDLDSLISKITELLNR